MRKLIFILMIMLSQAAGAQELLANVQVNYSQLGSTNPQVFKTMEKTLRDFVNNTSWTGRKLQNFEKIKCNFAILLTGRNGNQYSGSIVVQASRPVFNTTYESPLLNINDQKFEFEYNENENLAFNERAFSGKNMIDVIAFYTYLILGYDADSFAQMGGQPWFEKALKISQNSQNQRFSGWSQSEGPRTRARLIETLLNPDSNTMRNSFYSYHRNGMDQLYQQDQNQAKRGIFSSLMMLKQYETNFQMNYPFNIYMDTKKDEIYNVFSGRNTSGVNISELQALLNTLSPKDSEKWNKLK